MIVKINLKTACGCTRTIYEQLDNSKEGWAYLYPYYRVPIYHTDVLSGGVSFRDIGCTLTTRIFNFVSATPIYKRRVEIWYQERVV